MITCTAFELLGKYSELVDTSHLIRIKGGRTLYEHAAYVSDNTVRLARISVDPVLHQVNRYVHYDTLVELIQM